MGDVLDVRDRFDIQRMPQGGYTVSGYEACSSSYISEAPCITPLAAFGDLDSALAFIRDRIVKDQMPRFSPSGVTLVG